MNIHEFQAKKLLAEFGVPVPEGIVAADAKAAGKAFTELGVELAVVKAQIHAGGRGKAGGVKLVRSAEEAEAAAAGMLGKAMVTHQTGPEGRVVKQIYVESGSAIDRELYVALAVDRAEAAPVLICSTEGGMDIEEVADRTPEKIVRIPLHPTTGLLGYQGRAACFALGLQGSQMKSGLKVLAGLARAFKEKDCSLAEINPLIVTKDGQVVALDAKMNFDSNALYRQKDVVELRDLDEEDPKEIEAGKFGLSYIALDGNIGCMVNGAGLAMSTMDVIQLKGGTPANFLDVGGGANEEQVKNAFRIILSDPNVKGVLVNIFGGIMKCDTIAQGVIAAAKEMAISVPVVVRLEGTNVKEGRKLLDESGLNLTTAANLDEAAEKVVALTKS